MTGGIPFPPRPTTPRDWSMQAEPRSRPSKPRGSCLRRHRDNTGATQPWPGIRVLVVVRKPRHDTERDLSFNDTISHNGRRIAVAGTLAVLTAVALLAATARPAAASTSQWSFFEDHSYLIRSTPQVRDATLAEIKALGADSLRVEVKWNEVAPQPDSRTKPSFDATDPAAYPGFWPYDDLIQKATGMGFRIMITLAPDAPRWATAGKRGGNYKVSSTEFARFARAVGRRYSGAFSGVPAVRAWSLWNEPNHIF